MVRASVVLPEPDWPTSAMISSRATVRSTPATALMRFPVRSRNETRRFSALSSGSPGARSPSSGGSGVLVAGAKRDTGSPTVGNAAARAWLCGCCGERISSALGRSSTISPSYITAMRAQVAASTDRSWLIMIRPMPCSATSRESSSRTWAWTITSSAVVGSSAMISRGAQASAIAIMTRCFWPPDSSCGYAPARPGGRSTLVSSSATRALISFSLNAFPAGGCSRIGSAICSPMRRTGLSACIAPWNTTDASAQRTARSRPHFIVVTSSPSRRMSPVIFAVRGSSRSTLIATVDFPEPDSPATPRVSPGLRVRSTPRTAGTSPPRVV